MNCPACGSGFAPGDEFCGACGTPLGGGSAPVTRSEQRLPPLRPPGSNLPPPQAESAQTWTALPHVAGPEDNPILGEAMPNEQYTGLRMVYEQSAEVLDPISSRKFFWSMLWHWLRWTETGVIVTGVLFLLGIRSPGLLGFLWLAWFVGYCFLPVRTPISEWKFMVDGQGAAAEQAFEHIAWVFRQRETPVSRLKVGRVRLGLRKSRDFLQCRLGDFQGYISCFAFGRDLYIGWTFWWRLSTVRYWLLRIQRAFQGMTMRNSELHWILRYDNAKALREVIHGAAREGVDAASGAIAFQGSGTIGTDIAVDTVAPREGMEGLASRFDPTSRGEAPTSPRPGAPGS